jgi:hypothetical protein
MLRTILAAVFVLQVLPFARAAEPNPTSPQHRSWKDGIWQVVETKNIRVATTGTEAEALKLAQAGETLRISLRQRWLGTESTKAAADAWTPKCYLVVHPTAESYLREVGPGQQTAGSSFIEINNKQLITRRIDLRADHPQGYDDALAHEMTHIVIAERFLERQIPRWADEGIAVLADSIEKQSAHLADLQMAHEQGRSFRLVQLFTFENYPAPDHQATFYGQSVSIARFLLDRGSSEQLVQFVEHATHHGYESAARDIYGFSGVAELERQWLSQLPSAAKTASTWPAARPSRKASRASMAMASM